MRNIEGSVRLPSPEHFFLGLPDHMWTALSALATVLAVVVALLLPVFMRKLDDREARKRLKVSYAEVAAATRSALKCLLWALDDADKGGAHGVFDLVRVAARAASRAETLRLLSGREGLSDDAVSSCIAAAQSMDQITQASHHLTRESVVRRHLNAALALGHEARERVIEVITDEAVCLPADDGLPVLPSL